MRQLLYAIFCIILTNLMFPSAGSLHSQQKEGSKIVFLHLQMKDHAITLLRSSVHPGVLKRQRSAEKSAGISYDVANSSGESLWTGFLDDPLIQRYEYEDPSNPGRLKVKYVKQTDVEFTLRIPLKEGIRYISFYRLESSNLLPKEPRNLRALIGRIELRLTEGNSR